MTPLYQGVQINRALSLDQLHVGLLVNVAYLVVVAAVGFWIASRRLARLLLP